MTSTKVTIDATLPITIKDISDARKNGTLPTKSPQWLDAAGTPLRNNYEGMKGCIYKSNTRLLNRLKQKHQDKTQMVKKAEAFKLQVNKQLGVLIDSAHQEAADLEQEENVRMVEVRATISDCTIEGLTRGDPSQLWDAAIQKYINTVRQLPQE